MPALRNLAGAGWASWASALTLPGLVDQFISREVSIHIYIRYVSYDIYDIYEHVYNIKYTYYICVCVCIPFLVS